jgi:hypothetical protein
MKKPLTILVSLVLYSFLHAQPFAGIYRNLLPYSSIQKTALAFPANQAALADVDRLSFGIYGERRFLLQQLGWYDLVIALPLSFSHFGMQIIYMGGGAQQQTQLALAYARRMNKVQMGLQFNRHSMVTRGYGQSSYFDVEGGLIFQLNTALRTGFHIRHTAGPPGRHYGIPAGFMAGFGYDVSQQFYLGLLVAKTEDRDAEVQAGFEYALHQLIGIRCGIATSTGLFYFGIGLALQGFRIDLTVSVHEQLGMTPGSALLYPSMNKE